MKEYNYFKLVVYWLDLVVTRYRIFGCRLWTANFARVKRSLKKFLLSLLTLFLTSLVAVWYSDSSQILSSLPAEKKEE